MKKILIICAISLTVAACGGGKHEPIQKDSSGVKADSGTQVTGTGAGVADTVHPGSMGSTVNPIDTANPNKNPK